MGQSPRAAVERALSEPDIWTALADLAREAPPGLAAYVADHYHGFDPGQRRNLAWLLGMLPAEEAGPALTALLRTARKVTASNLLQAANRARVALPADVVLRLLDHPQSRDGAVAAAGLARREPAAAHAALVGRLVHLLDDRGSGRAAAIAIGRMKATEHTATIADRLPRVSEFDHESFVVALELMSDPSAVPALRARIRRAPTRTVYGLHHALRRFTGRDPLLPLDDEEWLAAARTAWSTVDAEPAGVADVVVDGNRATFVVRGGAGLVDIGDDPPSPGSSWARWDRSLLIGGDRTYRLGSTCGTCETTLVRIGWPARRAADRAATLRQRIAHVPALTGDLIDAAAPLLTALRTGHFVAALVDLDLELVTEASDSWLERRIARRVGVEHAPIPPGDGHNWIGTAHFQVREPLADDPPTYGVVMPTQPIDEPDRDRIGAFRMAIRAGERPAAVVLGWIDSRYIEAQSHERFLVGMVLDGHHKLLAYTAEGRPARALLVCRIEDSWGPPANRTQWLDETIGPLIAST